MQFYYISEVSQKSSTLFTLFWRLTLKRQNMIYSLSKNVVLWKNKNVCVWRKLHFSMESNNIFLFSMIFTALKLRNLNWKATSVFGCLFATQNDTTDFQTATWWFLKGGALENTEVNLHVRLWFKKLQSTGKSTYQ